MPDPAASSTAVRVLKVSGVSASASIMPFAGAIL
jgi:hypothetical protein